MSIATKVYYKNPLSAKEEIDVATGVMVIKRFDERLDESVLKIPFSTQQKAYQPFHKIYIESDDGVSTREEVFYILNDSVELRDKEETYFTHTIALVELTKKHERYLLGNKQFSRKKSGAAYYSIYSCLMILKQIIEHEYLMENIFSIPEDIKSILERIDAPEISMTEVTLRQAINEVLKVIDSTYRLLDNGDIELVRYNEIKERLDEIKFEDYAAAVDGEYSGTHIFSNVRNITSSPIIYVSTGPGNTLTEQKVSSFPTILNKPGSSDIVSGSSFRPPTGSTIRNESNLEIILVGELPINKIDQVYFSGIVGARFDMTSYVFTKTEYEALPSTSNKSDLKTGKYKQNAVFYEIGGNKITGWGIDYSTFFGSLSTVIKNIFYSATGFDYSGSGVLSIDNSQVLVIYTPLVKETLLKITRTDIAGNDLIGGFISNQSTRNTEVKATSKKLQGQIDRLGNEEQYISKNYTSLNEIKNLGDVISESHGIISEIELTYQNEFISVRYTIVKNFNKLSEFIGTSSAIREFNVPIANLQTRNVVRTEYCEISLENKSTFPPDSFICHLNKTNGGEENVGFVSHNIEVTTFTFIGINEITKINNYALSTSNTVANVEVTEVFYEKNILPSEVRVDVLTVLNFLKVGFVGQVITFDLNDPAETIRETILSSNISEHVVDTFEIYNASSTTPVLNFLEINNFVENIFIDKISYFITYKSRRESQPGWPELGYFYTYTITQLESKLVVSVSAPTVSLKQIRNNNQNKNLSLSTHTLEFDRNELNEVSQTVKFYYKIKSNTGRLEIVYDPSNSITTSLSRSVIADFFAEGEYSNKIKMLNMQTTNVDIDTAGLQSYENGDNLQLGSSAYSMGARSTLSFISNQIDNFIIGDRIAFIDNKYLKKSVKYTDRDGFWDSFREVYFINYLDAPLFGRAEPDNYPLIISRLTPPAKILLASSVNAFKDPADIINIVFQLSFVSDSEDIIIGDALTDFNPLVSETVLSKSRLYLSDELYDKSDVEVAKGTSYSTGISVRNNEVTLGKTVTSKSFALTVDGDRRRLLVAFNNPNELPIEKFYINFSSKRSGVVYDW